MKPSLWTQPSAEFMLTALAVLVLPVSSGETAASARWADPPRPWGSTRMNVLQSLTLKLIRASLWPLYFLLLAYAARLAPWPRSLGILVSALLTAAAIGLFVHDMLRWLVWPSADLERLLNIPQPVARQLDHTGRFLLVAAFLSLLPLYIFDHELIAPEGRPFTAPRSAGSSSSCTSCWSGEHSFACSLGDPHSSSGWLPPSLPATAAALAVHSHCRFLPAASRRTFTRAWLGSAFIADWSLPSRSRHSLRSSCLMYAAIASQLAVSPPAVPRLCSPSHLPRWPIVQSAEPSAATRGGGLGPVIPGRWLSPRQWPSRASTRSRSAIGGLTAAPAASAESSGAAEDSVPLEDLAAGLLRLCSYAMIALTLLANRLDLGSRPGPCPLPPGQAHLVVGDGQAAR